MHIAFLSSHPIQYQAPLFRSLAARPGIEVTALFCHDHGARPSLDPGFGQTIQFDTPLLSGYEWRMLPNLAPRPSVTPWGMINPSIITRLLRDRYDVLIVHGYTSPTMVASLVGPHHNTRVILRGESNLVHRRSAQRTRVKQVVLRSIFKRVDHFLSIGSLNTAYYRNYGVPESRITLAPYTVDNLHFAQGSAEARSDRPSARRHLGIPEDGVAFLSSGKLIPRKRPFDLLRAFTRSDLPERSSLVFVGDGPLRFALEQAAQDLGVSHRVVFLGFRNQSELPAIYGSCDVLVLASERETWGLVVNEAMAAGLVPVVSDQVGAGPDLVESAQIFSPGDEAALASILRRLASDPSSLIQARRQASEKIEHWGLEQTTDGILRGVASALA
jgi:glycosyltransferase involved in cell wall biosynthesis